MRSNLRLVCSTGALGLYTMIPMTSWAAGQAGAISFTGHYDLTLTEIEDGTKLRLGLRITETNVGAVPYIAGIETGWGQVLKNLADAVYAFPRTNNSAQPNAKGRK